VAAAASPQLGFWAAAAASVSARPASDAVDSGDQRPAYGGGGAGGPDLGPFGLGRECTDLLPGLPVPSRLFPHHERRLLHRSQAWWWWSPSSPEVVGQ
jgi:hypothetical protein